MIITSKLLAQFSRLRSGVSTRLGGVSPEPYGMNLSFKVGDGEENVRENRERFFGQLGIGCDSLAYTQQVHEDTIKCAETPGQHSDCDALMAQQQGVFLTVTVADCLPIFIFDPVTVSVAVVHSGWRGSKLRITEKTVKALRTKYGAESKNLIAFIGPSAGVCCYEVGEEVANEFLGNFLERKQNSRPHLDLKNFNRNLLLESGVKESNIEVSDYCTICNPDLFHSYRRDKERSGRMMGVIGLATT